MESIVTRPSDSFEYLGDFEMAVKKRAEHTYGMMAVAEATVPPLTLLGSGDGPDYEAASARCGIRVPPDSHWVSELRRRYHLR